METITSFTIDHTKLKRGIYVSRKDRVAGGTVTTFDLRMKEPNNEQPLSSATAHTIEHIGATFLRNHESYGQKTLYFGPMGCLTGFYLLLSEDRESREIIPLIRELFEFTSRFKGAIPGASKMECGNYTLMDLPQANLEAEKFCSEILWSIDELNLFYPAS